MKKLILLAMLKTTLLYAGIAILAHYPQLSIIGGLCIGVFVGLSTDRSRL